MSVATKFDKIMRKSVGENVKCALKLRQFYPQFETFPPLKSLLCQFYVAKRPLELYKICNIIFEHFQ